MVTAKKQKNSTAIRAAACVPYLKMGGKYSLGILSQDYVIILGLYGFIFQV